MTVSIGPEAERLAEQYCGEGPLPAGSSIIGTVKWQGREGALVKAEHSFYAQVVLREYWILDDNHVLAALLEVASVAVGKET